MSLSRRLSEKTFTILSEQYQAQLNHLDFAISNFIENINMDLTHIVLNDIVRIREDVNFTNYLIYNKNSFKYSNDPGEKKIIEVFNLFAETHPYANSIYMGRENGSFIGSGMLENIEQFDPRESVWYNRGRQSRFTVSMTESQVSEITGNKVVIFVKPLMDSSGIFYGVVAMEVSLDEITKYLSTITPGEDGYISIIDSKGVSLVSTGEQIEKTNLQYMELHQEFIKKTSHSELYLGKDSSLDHKYIFSKISVISGWTISVVIPILTVQTIVDNMVMDNIKILLAALFTLILIALLGVRILITTPLISLTKKVQHITDTGDLDSSIIIKRNDEFGLLSRSFNTMIFSIKEVNISLSESKVELQEHKDNLENLVIERTMELSKLSEAIKHSASAILITDSDGIVEYVNPGFTEITGYSEKEIIGKNPIILQFRGMKPKSFYSKIWDTILSGQTWIGEFPNKMKDGTLYWNRASISPVFDDNGTIINYVGVQEDITEQKLLESELDKARIAAEDASKAKSEFLANMSHEIRTPMNAVIGLTHLALQTELTVKQSDYIEKIKISAGALLRIINDILDFSKIEAGKLSIEEAGFDLDDVLRDVSLLILTKTTEYKLEYLISKKTDIPVKLIGDAVRLGQVITNLCSNAVKFTKEGEIVLKVEVEEDLQDFVVLRFSVKDSGIGMSKKQSSLLFKPFTQGDSSTTRKYGGTGLGLSISKQLVNMMGGEISVKSTEGKGSIFSFTAKFGINKEEKKSVFEYPVDVNNLRVLIVDDNKTSLEILQEYLEAMSFRVTTADSGPEGLNEFNTAKETHPYDIVIVDWFMPEMSGIETAEILKSENKDKSSPVVIMVTAYGSEEGLKENEKAFFDGFLVKPVTQSTLFDSIMIALGKAPVFNKKIPNSKDLLSNSYSALKGRRVLLVEDNEINQQVAKELLEKIGLIVELAWNGKEAIELASKKTFDIILMDIQMPEMDGYKATEIIRKKEENRVPILAMTANAMEGDVKVSLDYGMDDHISKPIEPDELYKKLLKWINTDTSAKDIHKSNNYTEQKKEHQNFIPDIPGIDSKTSLKRIGGNKELYIELLVLFKDQYRNMIEDIGKALNEGKKYEAEMLSHSLKGAAGSIGADFVMGKSSELEQALKSGESVDNILVDLNKLLMDLIENLNSVNLNIDGTD